MSDIIGSDALTFELTQFFTNAKSRIIRSIRQFCEDEIIIADGPYRGQPFRIDRQPAIGLWFDQIDSGHWNELFFTAPSQWGKTLVAFIAPAIYHTTEMAENYVMAVPDMRMGQNKWEVDLRPSYEASPNLRKLLPTTGEGSRGGKISDSITLNNGKIIKWMTAGGDDTQKAGFTARIVGVTEAARFSSSSETSVESDPLRQIEARQRAYKSHQRRLYVEGTVTIEEELPWRAFATSSKSKILTPCPHCESWIAPERDHLCGWEEAESELQAAEMAVWFCYKCGEIITDQQRLASIADCKIVHGDQTIDEHGEIIGDMPETRRLFFRATSWLNGLLATADLGVDEWRAAQIDEDSPERESENKRLCQFVWCVPYAPPMVNDVEIDRDAAARRTLEGHPRGVVPDDTIALAVGTDVGKWQCWWVALALRADGRRHVVDYGSVDVDSKNLPEEESIPRALLDISMVVREGWRKSSGEIYSVDSWWIDSGYKTRVVEKFVAREKDRTGKNTWCLAAGGLGESVMRSRKYSSPKKTGNEVREIDPKGKFHLSWLRQSRIYGVEWDADDGKLRVQNSLVIPSHHEGATTLFTATAKAHRRFVRHHTNERRIIEKHAMKGEILVWKRTGDNHLMDCSAMADTAVSRVIWRREVMARMVQTVDASHWE